MKVKAKTTIQVLNNEKELVAIFIKDKTYHARKNTDLGWGYIVINELGEENLYIDKAFNLWFEKE